MQILRNLPVFAALFWLGCNPKYDCSSGNLQFNLPVQVSGLKDTLNIGDTLRVRLDIPDKLVERNLGVEYDFIDYNFKLITYIGKIDSLPSTAETTSAFDWTTTQGESVYVNGVFLVLPTYVNNLYQYEALIVPKRKGLYVFGMNSDAWRLNPLENVSGPCSGNVVYVFPKHEDNVKTNYEFMKLSPDPSNSNMQLQQFNEAAGLCFFVR